MEKVKKIKLHVRRGDEVLVIAGDEKGKKGKVTKVLPAQSKAIVGGLNKVKRHVKPTAQKPQGSIVEKEAPLHVSNLKVVTKSTDTKKVVREKSSNN